MRPLSPHRRVWLQRLALLVGSPVVALGLLEGGLRLGGYGHPSSFLIPDERPGYFRSNPEFAGLFLPGGFDLRPLNFRVARRKAPGTLRVVVLGESAAQGVPVPSFGFAEQLRAQLRARYPGRTIEVLNTGIVAIDSHVVYAIARDLAGFEPDLFVVYMGNNEVVGPYGPGCAYLSATPPLWVIRASVWVRSLRLGQLLSAAAARLGRHGGSAPEWGGMSMFVNHAVPGDDPRLGRVYSNFARNLEDIVGCADGAGARTVLCTVVANLKDCAPFLSVHRTGMSPSELSSWQTAFDDGRLAWRLGDTRRAEDWLTKAQQLDPQYADTRFMLGSLALQEGDSVRARAELSAALHWDALRFRPDPEINRIIRRIAALRPGAKLVDAAMALGSDPGSSEPVSGRELLFEHVHFDWEGNYRLTRMIADAAVDVLPAWPGARSADLDIAACAAALAYTPHERLPMLLRMDVLVRKPPFSNQLTYVDHEARMAADIAAATRLRADPNVVAHAFQVAQAAAARDPDNPALAGILEGIDLDRNDPRAALVEARRAEDLLPRDIALDVDEASILGRLGQVDEGERILAKAASGNADWTLLAPAWVDFCRTTKRFDGGRRLLDQVIARRPSDYRLKLARGALLRAAGDRAGAERDFRAVWEAQPANDEALEGLVALLDQKGEREESDRVAVAGAERQPNNQTNDLRVAKLFEGRKNPGEAVRYFEAAERSGPVDATYELTVALKLYQLGRTPEMLERLAEAERLSLREGNPQVTASIRRLIARFGG